ncbi:hypothetical protein RRG08_002321 [Elysia crispata]|uniref:Uncharacterized protein n=1 Tax=Elysia crispata TaxID=231223 RepID=A0AAE0ZBA2_9GAST|nr:hypothetical protein RRG08_002321 [Elysia crispata]
MKTQTVLEFGELKIKDVARSNPTRETILVSWSSCYAGIPFAVRSGAVMTLQSPETGLSRQMTSWDKLAKADRLGRATYYTEETESCV